MATNLTFIIPIRHPDNSKNWSQLVENLKQTVRSIAAQTSGDWRAVIVANEGASLPDLPDRFDVVRVGFPPNPNHEFNTENLEAVYDSFRLDKGRRVLAGMLHARPSTFFMIVDDDDFVSNQIADFVSKHNSANGWKIRNGFVWGDGGKLLILNTDFNNFCGTSLIVRADNYRLPDRFEDASEDYIKTMLGSHVRIGKILEERRTPLADLPFIGAVYRIGHAGAHSKSKGIIRKYFLNKTSLSKPAEFLVNMTRVRFLGPSIKKSYFGF